MMQEKILSLSGGDQLIFHKEEVMISFADIRKTICTSPLGGGIRRDVTGVFNHCDKNYETGSCPMRGDTYIEHLQQIARELKMNPDKTAGLSTACPMKAAAVAGEEIRGIRVTAIVTGGIEKNGRIAGDKANLWEENGQYSILDGEAVIPDAGTINILLHIDADLTDGALAGAVMVATEAKTAAIMKMHLKSCYSDRIATGSGTDGIIVIGNPFSNRHITQVRTDTKLGETISNVIIEALEKSMTKSSKLIYLYEEYGQIP